MPDLEERLRRSLRSHAAGAPSAHDLAPAARARFRRRRTARAVVVAAAVLAVAVPVGVQALGGHAPDAVSPVTAPRVDRPPADGFSPAPSGWRWESGNGLQALVPDTWGYGVDLAGGCVGSIDPGVPGAVEVPGVHLLHGCIPQGGGRGYVRYLAFWDLTPRHAPARTTVGRWTTVRQHVGGGVVTVQDDDPAELRRILRSVSVVRGTDHNGCPLGPPVSNGRPAPLTVPAGERPDVVAVCRYGSRDRNTRLLSFSTVLSPARAARVHRALWTAPTAGLFRSGCLDVRFPGPVALVRERYPQGWRTFVVEVTGCPPYVDEGTAPRALDAEVARAMLIGYREPVDTSLGRLAGNWLRDNHR